MVGWWISLVVVCFCTFLFCFQIVALYSLRDVSKFDSYESIKDSSLARSYIIDIFRLVINPPLSGCPLTDEEVVGTKYVFAQQEFEKRLFGRADVVLPFNVCDYGSAW